ncbi:MAG: right-handed parallel beta-helix repeat-containing protein [Planctomycetota bacterium]
MKKTFFIAVLLICATANFALATTRTVPQWPYMDIQSAIDASIDGDIVRVKDNIYQGPGNTDLDFQGKAIIVRSANGPQNCIIDCDNYTTDPNRAFHFHSGEDANAIVEGFTIRDGYIPGNGGAILCEPNSLNVPSSPTITNCIIKNSSANYGGAISCISSSPTITNCTIKNNTATFDGGAIYCYNASPAITDCNLSHNQADNGDGGGIYCSNAASLTIADSVIYNNTAAINGGGIYSLSSTPEISNTCIKNNDSEGYGGGIYCLSSAPIINNNSKIVHNIASNPETVYGGGIYCSASSPLITDCNISNNKVESGNYLAYGGGIYCDQATTVVINNSIISENLAASGDFDACGGGFYSQSSSLTIIKSTISGNSAVYGGGFNVLDSNLTINHCKITTNFSSGGGGGMYIENDSNGIIEDCVISGNSGSLGGAIECDSNSSPTIRSCVISGNDATGFNGGAIDCFASSPNIINCTISSNEAYQGYGGGISCETDTERLEPLPSQPLIQNCIFEDNYPYAIYEFVSNPPGLGAAGSDPTITYCLFYDNYPDMYGIYGDYWDHDTGYSYTGMPGPDSINNIPDGYASYNTGGDPLFLMNGPAGITGQWTSSPVYTSEPNRTILTDSLATFIPDEFAGLHINPNTDQSRHVIITANTATSIEVLGDVTSYVSNGSPYQIIDYHLLDASPCAQTGDPNYSAEPNEVDLDYQPRVVAGRVDIGGDEFALIGDYNYDGWIDITDLGYFAAHWLDSGCSGDAGDATSWCFGTDLDKDGVVNLIDFEELAGYINE